MMRLGPGASTPTRRAPPARRTAGHAAVDDGLPGGVLEARGPPLPVRRPTRRWWSAQRGSRGQSGAWAPQPQRVGLHLERGPRALGGDLLDHLWPKRPEDRGVTDVEAGPGDPREEEPPLDQEEQRAGEEQTHAGLPQGVQATGGRRRHGAMVSRCCWRGGRV